MFRSDGSFTIRNLVLKILASVLISLGTIVVIFSLSSLRGITVDLTGFRPGWLGVAFGSLVGAWMVDGTRIWITVWAWKKRIRFRHAMTTVLSCYFMNTITPSSTGGSAAEMITLTRAGLTWGEATSLVIIGGIMYQVALFVLLAILVFGFRVQFALTSVLMKLLYSFLVLYSIMLFFLFFFLRRTDLIIKLTGWTVRLIKKRFPRIPLSEQTVIEWIRIFFREFQTGFSLLFVRKPGYLLLNTGCHILYFLFYFFVAYFVLLSLGALSLDFQVLAIQVPLFYIFGVIPTPGASGGVEISLASVFLPYIGENRIGMFVLFWRSITYVFPLIVGGIAFFRTLSIMGLIHSESDHNPGE